MPRKRFTNEQIAFAYGRRRTARRWTRTARKWAVRADVSNRWKKQYIGMGVPENRVAKAGGGREQQAQSAGC